MGAYGFDRFKEELKLRLGNRTDMDSPTDWVGRWINSAYLQLTTRNRLFGLKKNFSFPELETRGAASTVDGTAYVATPTDALVVRSVWNSTNDTPLKNIGWDTYLEGSGRADTNAEGPPTAWVRSGSSIYLRPTPDAVYALYVYYRKRPAVLTGTDVTVIGAEWDEVILRMAANQAYLQLHEYDHLKAEQEALGEYVGGLIGIYEQEDRTKKEYVQPDPSYITPNSYG
ncbi:MAG: hypothetical protein WC554_16350 [Clostridia bacterium]|jgi:hypothetical protein